MVSREETKLPSAFLGNITATWRKFTVLHAFCSIEWTCSSFQNSVKFSSMMTGFLNNISFPFVVQRRQRKTIHASLWGRLCIEFCNCWKRWCHLDWDLDLTTNTSIQRKLWTSFLIVVYFSVMTFLLTNYYFTANISFGWLQIVSTILCEWNRVDRWFESTRNWSW